MGIPILIHRFKFHLLTVLRDLKIKVSFKVKKSNLVEIMSWNVVDEVVLQSPEGVSAGGPPATRSSCPPGPRSLDLYPWKKKKAVYPKNHFNC